MDDNRKVIGVLVMALSVVLAPVLFIGGIVLTNNLLAQGYAREDLGWVALACTFISLSIGCFGFFFGLYLVNPWLPVAYVAYHHFRNHEEE
ncbi:MAG: hypothetical protein PHV42_04380 [Candidatus Pacebacteria bacterium]|nr:hypothetical protein [Candidatus Paceibacterota bacterium]